MLRRSWVLTSGGILSGSMHGVSNACLLSNNRPVPCESCDQVGATWGRLEGQGFAPIIGPKLITIEAIPTVLGSKAPHS